MLLFSRKGPGGGGEGGGRIELPLNFLEIRARRHALLCSIGFLILLPVGALIARYSRTLRYKWFWAHWIFQLVIAGPVIFVGWANGYQLTTVLETGHFKDPHQKMGLALLILYVIQILLGAIAHFFKLPSLFRGRRPAHSYLHVLVGLAIIAAAQWQVHYGLFTEWIIGTGGEHEIPDEAKNAWLALVIVFWVVYGLGMALLPRQFSQERQNRLGKKEDPASTTTSA